MVEKTKNTVAFSTMPVGGGSRGPWGALADAPAKIRLDISDCLTKNPAPEGLTPPPQKARGTWGAGARGGDARVRPAGLCGRQHRRNRGAGWNLAALHLRAVRQQEGAVPGGARADD